MGPVLPPVLPDLFAPVAPAAPEVLAVAYLGRLVREAQRFLLVLVRPAGPGPDQRAPAMSEPRIDTEVVIKRRVLASFRPDTLARLTGIPEATLLTPFDTWSDQDAETFLDFMSDDTGYIAIDVRDDSEIGSYYITEKEGT